MFRLVTDCDPGMLNQSLALATSTELDCAIQPRCDPGQLSLSVLPPLTLKTMFVGVVDMPPVTAIETVAKLVAPRPSLI